MLETSDAMTVLLMLFDIVTIWIIPSLTLLYLHFHISLLY